MESRIPSPAADTIAKELKSILSRPSLGRVFFAEGDAPPPELAFLVRFPRLSLTLKGCDSMEIGKNGKTEIIEPIRGDVVFVPANCWNKPAWKHRMKSINFLFGQKHLGISLVEHNGHNREQVHAKMANVHRAIGGPMQSILSALTELQSETKKSPVDRLLISALLHYIINLLNEPKPASGKKARNTYERICLYLQEHFHTPLTRESVANAFDLNPNHLSRLFRKEGLIRFNDYLTWVRIERAKFLLKHHNLNLHAVAAACSYSDISYFCRIFKSKTKQTPSEYRRIHSNPARGSLP